MFNKKFLCLFLLCLPVFGFNCSPKTEFGFDIVKEEFGADHFGDFIVLQLKFYNGKRANITSIDFSLKTCDGRSISPSKLRRQSIPCEGGFVPMLIPCAVAFDLPDDLPEDCLLELHAQANYNGFYR